MLMLIPGASCIAQKSIIISDSLNANAEKLNVKTGNSWPWKVYRFSFGDYEVASSKGGWGTASSGTNLPGTKSQSKSASKFSFVLTNKTNDSVQVNAAYKYSLRELHQLAIFPVFSGREELLEVEFVNDPPTNVPGGVIFDRPAHHIGCRRLMHGQFGQHVFDEDVLKCFKFARGLTNGSLVAIPLFYLIDAIPFRPGCCDR